jgi:hypothetical protein
MRRELCFKQGIISGDMVRDVLSVWPHLKNSFEQRKSFDEYYYSDKVVVDISVDDLQKLSELYINININFQEIQLD